MKTSSDVWETITKLGIPNLWVWDISTQEFYISSHINYQLGLVNNIITDLDSLKSKTYVLDLPLLQESTIREFTRTSDYFERKIRLYNIQGEFVYYQLNGFVQQRDSNQLATKLIGTFTNVTYLIKNPKENNPYHEYQVELELIVKGIDAGIWDWDLQNDSSWWSPKFYELLGYQPYEIEPSFNTFMNVLLHPDDKEKTNRCIYAHLYQKKNYKTEIRLLTKSGIYKWFQSSGQAKWNSDTEPTKMSGSIIDITETVAYRASLESNEFLLNESSRLAKIGGWEVSLNDKKILWSKGVKEIHEYPFNDPPSLDDAFGYYHESSQSIIKAAFYDTIQNGKPFDVTCLLVTHNQNQVWVRVIGSPVMSEQQKIIGIRGVIKDINDEKKKELSLQDSLKIINEQNSKLLNFAHIVSHNLRSHTGNLEMVTNFIEECSSDEERVQLLQSIKKISGNLSNTILHLNDVLMIQSQVQKPKTKIYFQDVLDQTCIALLADIQQQKAQIEANFIDAPFIKYIPAYLESIFLNIIANAIKYRKPKLPPIIKIRSGVENEKITLSFEDNGQGINLEKQGKKVFGMYNTFHNHPDAKGFGLFLTKNQLDLMGSTIEVTSQENIGTTFKITF